jgi:hypothetical protein
MTLLDYIAAQGVPGLAEVHRFWPVRLNQAIARQRFA